MITDFKCNLFIEEEKNVVEKKHYFKVLVPTKNSP